MRLLGKSRREEQERENESPTHRWPHKKRTERSNSTPPTVAPLAPSLKKTPSNNLAQKWSAYIEAIGIKDSHNDHHTDKARRHVHFPPNEKLVDEEFEIPEATDEEKANCHYSVEELGQMNHLAKELRQSKFAGQSKDTILQQGFLAMRSPSPFFQQKQKQYYCLLKDHTLFCYASPAHAAKNTGLKYHFTVLRVQDCQTMSMAKKIALFGATLPPKIGLMFVVNKNDGERVVFTAETRSFKRNWVHTLTKVTFVGEGGCVSELSSPPSRKQHPPASPHEYERMDLGLSEFL